MDDFRNVKNMGRNRSTEMNSDDKTWDTGTSDEARQADQEISNVDRAPPSINDHPSSTFVEDEPLSPPNKGEGESTNEAWSKRRAV